MSGHTPGPWDWLARGANAGGGHHLYIIDATNRKIAALWGKAEEKEANAQLVAAAPDMLAALKVVAENWCNDFTDEWPVIEAAIAKAEGRS